MAMIDWAVKQQKAEQQGAGKQQTVEPQAAEKQQKVIDLDTDIELTKPLPDDKQHSAVGRG